MPALGWSRGNKELIPFDNNRPRTYKTRDGTPLGSGIGIVTASPHISPTPTQRNMVNVNVDNINLRVSVNVNSNSCLSVGSDFLSNSDLSVYSYSLNNIYLLVGSYIVRSLEIFRFRELGESLDAEKISHAKMGEKLVSATRTVADAEAVEAHGRGPCFREFEFPRPPQVRCDHPEDMDIGECDPGFPPEDI